SSQACAGLSGRRDPRRQQGRLRTATPALPLALTGALAAALRWEVSGHVLVGYVGTLSQIGTVYGSLTTVIAVLLSLEIVATLLLLGAQVMAEFERLGEG
ncbi:hypothetical protein DBR42_12790, partial [Pelomonas sp. HMWF004]